MTTTHVRLIADARCELARRPPALVILDVGLPDGSGFEFCCELRSARVPPIPASALPIILLTARSEEIDRVVGLELGADDYVSKPFSRSTMCSITPLTFHQPGLMLSSRQVKFMAQFNST